MKQILSSLFVFLLLVLMASCSDDEKANTSLLNLDKTQASVQIGDVFNVNISFENKDNFKTVKVIKAINGKVVSGYNRVIDVASIPNPYKFEENVINGDEVATVTYSFIGLDASGQQLDAMDCLLNVELAYEPLLLKYDWSMVTQMIGGADWASDTAKDDVYRFNADKSYQRDWKALSNDKLETLDAYCAWKPIGTGAKMDSIYLIKYNVLNPVTPDIIKYKVIKMENKELILETRMDLSWLGLASDEKVTETFESKSKLPSFKDAGYVIPACHPGSY